MSSASDYIAQCLAGCPEGAEEQLLSELARHLLTRCKADKPVVLRNQTGPFGFFLPATSGPAPLVEEDSPEFAAEVRRRLKSPDPVLSAETFIRFLKSQVQECPDPARESRRPSNSRHVRRRIRVSGGSRIWPRF
jgi:hypothetical protein